MENTNQNQTQSEVPPLDHLGEFDQSIQFLSDLPTDKAMREMAKMGRVPDSVRKVVETMALRKMDFVKTLRWMELRAKLGFANRQADKVIDEWVKTNPDYDVNITEK